MWKRVNRITQGVLGVLVALMLFAGCETVRRGNAMDTEQVLTAGGFQIKRADTPEKTAEIREMPQRRLVVSNHGEQPFWMYADAEFCKCLYVGNQSAYQRFQKLSQRRQVAEVNQAEELDRVGAWNPGLQ